ncbi:hypothetical protein mRhiFer1_008200 [Rhinolophus ferrumequinum]|uniref:Uncharacterized protein n=1 Tax=Rhinolophus ferrumequinum TaxID=59479 RepID=A0A7J7W816_RHIFE|nr:hypothetical protein mRhiFer1_008200 [Rhinolophus ferrumequinum]
MARGVHAGAVSVVAGPGDVVGRELPQERWCGWSGLGGHRTRGQSGCPADPRGLRAGAAPPAEAQGQPGGYPQRTGAPRSHPAAMCGCLEAGRLQRLQRCGCAGREATGCGRHEAELGPDSTVHLPERPGHGRGGRGQKEAADRGQEASRSLSHQIAQGGRPAHALHGEAGRWDGV